MSTFFISDMHFDHANIIWKCDRPFRSVDDMNNTIVTRWNATVGDNDVVFVLGDVALGRGETELWLSRLKGHKILIKGNHDHRRAMRNIEWHQSTMTHIEALGDVLLIHDPYNAPENWKGWIIHGHVHNNKPLINRRRKRVNVSVDVTDFRPVRLQTIINRIQLEEVSHDRWNNRSNNSNPGCPLLFKMDWRCRYCTPTFCARSL